MKADTATANDRDRSLRSLIAFAAARTYSANTNNPLNAILPLFEPIAATLHGRPFNEGDLSRELRDRYDLVVSEELCIHWSTQLKQQRLIIPISTGTSGGFEWSQPRIANAPDGAFSEELAEILAALRAFASNSGDLITESYTDDQLVGLLRRGTISTMFPRLYEGNNPNHSHEDEYIFSRFIEHLAANNKVVLDSISRLRRAVIYSDLILHLRAPRKPSANSQFVHAYFDSPLVMDLIGLGGRVRKAFAERLFRQLPPIKIVPLVSPVMVEEIRGNIRALVNREPRDRFGPTADALRHGEFKIDYVIACSERLEILIEDAGLTIDANFQTHLRPKYDDAGKNLEQELLSKLQGHYKMFGAAERDAKSLMGCFGRRDGSRPDGLYNAKCFFITSNSMLAAVGNKFFRENQGYSERTFPIVITRPTIAAMTDAIAGVSTTGDMSEQELIVSAADATSYDPQVFERIEAFLKEITPQEADEFSKILQRTDLSSLAMDLVRGSPQNVNAQRVSELIDNARTQLEIDAEKRVAANIAEERRLSAAKVSSLHGLVTEERTKYKGLSAQAVLRHDASSAAIIRRNSTADRWRQRSAKMGLLGAAIIGVAVGVAVFFLSLMAERISLPLKWAFSIIAALGAGIPLAGFPSARKAFASLVESIVAGNVSRFAKELGYDLPADRLLDEEELRRVITSQSPVSD